MNLWLIEQRPGLLHYSRREYVNIDIFFFFGYVLEAEVNPINEIPAPIEVNNPLLVVGLFVDMLLPWFELGSAISNRNITTININLRENSHSKY